MAEHSGWLLSKKKIEALVLKWCAAAHQCTARLWTEQRACAHHEGVGGVEVWLHTVFISTMELSGQPHPPVA